MPPGLGDSVKEHESADTGVDTVSRPGKKDKGRVSYGTYQLTSMYKGEVGGTVKVFLESNEGKQYAPEFVGLTPGSPEFSAKWHEIAGRDPDGLHQAERAFIYRTHYLPAARKAAELGLDMSNPAIQDAIWSGATQHGPGGFRNILDIASKADRDRDFKSLSAEDQLKAIYWARSNVWSPDQWSAGGGRYFGSPEKPLGEFEAIRARNEVYQQERVRQR